MQRRLPRRRRSTCVSLPCSVLTHLESLLRERRALDVFDGAEFPRESLAGFLRNWPLLLPIELLQDGRVIPEVDLSAHDQARHAGAVMVDLWAQVSIERAQRTSGNHFSLTFSKLAGLVTLKQTRKTSV